MQQLLAASTHMLTFSCDYNVLWAVHKSHSFYKHAVLGFSCGMMQTAQPAGLNMNTQSASHYIGGESRPAGPN